MAAIPAGWYPDPTGRFAWRRWDGDHWGAEVRVDPVAPIRIDRVGADVPAPGVHDVAAGRARFQRLEEQRRTVREHYQIALVKTALLVGLVAAACLLLSAAYRSFRP